MVYAVQFLETAVEELAEISQEAARQILKRIEGLKTVPRPAGVKQLKGPEKFLRLRVGDHRLIYLARQGVAAEPEQVDGGMAQI